MTEFCDLHTHSRYSDGTCAPAEIIEKAVSLGLSAVALTDHNTLDGLPEFLAAARKNHIKAIPGVEISTGYRGKELHIVGLFLPSDRLPELNLFLSEIIRRKELSNRQLVSNLNRGGYALDYDAIRNAHPDGTVNRAVIAARLLEKGYVGSIDEAFHTLLSKKSGYYVPMVRIDAFEAIAFLHSLGAVSILAHPFLNLSEPELRDFLPEAKHRGLVAMETHYATFTPEQIAAARSIAREFCLLESGGSDFHGTVKPDISLGTGRGNLRVPRKFAETLERKAESLCPGP